jgi:hypothetical protein
MNVYCATSEYDTGLQTREPGGEKTGARARVRPQETRRDVLDSEKANGYLEDKVLTLGTASDRLFLFDQQSLLDSPEPQC